MRGACSDRCLSGRIRAENEEGIPINRANATLFVGTNRTDITPDGPIHLIPTAPTPRTSTGVTRRLFARIAVFRQGGRNAVFVSADSLFIPHNRIEGLKRRIAETWGIDVSAVFVQATHTHSAPFPAAGYYAAVYDSSLDAEYDAYFRRVEDAVFAGVGSALAGLEPVTVWRGTGRCGFSSYRRKEIDGQWVMAPDDGGPKDPELTVVRFRREDGSDKALFVHFACHPTVTYEDRISPDYPGTAMELLEEASGDGAVALFLQGCCGDVRPGLVRDGKYYSGSDDDVRRLAGELADETRAVLARPMRELATTGIDCRRLEIELPFREVPAAAELEAWRDDPGHMGARSRKLLAHPQFLKPSESLRLGYLALAEGLALVGMSGEMVAAYGRYAKAAGGDRIVALGLTDGNAGYVPTARQLAEGGYEAYDFFYRHGFPSPYDPVVEEKVRAALDAIIGRQ